MVPDPTVRMKSSYYSVGEGDGSVEVCAEVTTDQFDSTFDTDYVTSAGSATGIDQLTHKFSHGLF